MKLIFCEKCSDVVRLIEKERTCECGLSSGRYLDGLNAVFSGPAIPLGFSNPTLALALGRQPEEGWGVDFKAFVIPKVCPTFIKED